VELVEFDVARELAIKKYGWWKDDYLH
jgi:hypothetical protein